MNDTLQQEQSFNLWWAHEISSSQNSSTHGEAQTVPVVNGFWPFQVGDQEDGIHSITHAMYSSFLHISRRLVEPQKFSCFHYLLAVALCRLNHAGASRGALLGHLLIVADIV